MTYLQFYFYLQYCYHPHLDHPRIFGVLNQSQDNLNYIFNQLYLRIFLRLIYVDQMEKSS